MGSISASANSTTTFQLLAPRFPSTPRHLFVSCGLILEEQRTDLGVPRHRISSLWLQKQDMKGTCAS
ncbi:hypothetical protein OPV22_030466 [Ensete ventricosum]|uniref:Uncharacterized protein n=1 Tax=Ensete ventricosum TaxID=4639 RepID=A0AAV8Q9W9_ENSVE|nr:hypothetical protein OPV22_030466 [Ensete ventricosum]